jgi:photosystem I subunit PsaO
MAAVASCRVVAPVAGLCGSSVAARPRSRVQLKSAFLGTRAVSQRICAPSTARVTCFVRDWLRTDLSVIGFGLIGWLAPSSIPAINGKSLTSLFFESIGAELSHFPTGPGLESDFWLWMFLWHFGLFWVLFFGQIGFKGRGDGLYD